MTILGWVALAALALTPLLIAPGAKDDAYIGPKWAWMAIWTAVGLASVAAGALTGRPAMFPFDAVWVTALGLMLWHWVRAAGAPSPSLAAERAAQVTWLLGAMGLALQLFIRRRILLRLAWTWIALAALTAAWTLLEDSVRAWLPRNVWLKPNLADWRGYLSAGLGNTSHIADLLALVFLP
ncbi:MAG: hypothetical protein M1457_00920, partial [bacterium]|nr:hypothetical protein [bacterium]